MLNKLAARDDGTVIPITIILVFAFISAVALLTDTDGQNVGSYPVEASIVGSV